MVGFQLSAEFVGNADPAEIGHAGDLLQGSGNQQSRNQGDAHPLGGESVAPGTLYSRRPPLRIYFPIRSMITLKHC